MNVISTMKSLYDELPTAERKVADYIFAHTDTVPHQSVNEVAQWAQVSVPSVMRSLIHCEKFLVKYWKVILTRN